MVVVFQSPANFCQIHSTLPWEVRQSERAWCLSTSEHKPKGIKKKEREMDSLREGERESEGGKERGGRGEGERDTYRYRMGSLTMNVSPLLKRVAPRS